MPKRLQAAGLALLLLAAQPLWAGPPFQTDDPDPVPYGHYEAYLFALSDGTPIAAAAEGPAAEFNWGAVPNVQLHLIIPVASYFQPQGPDTAGLGDIEAGMKYRFIHETKHRPEIGTFPMLELPTGSPQRNLGNGQIWARLPIWIQKGIGPWTTYGGVGEVINNAPGVRDYTFAGWLLQKELNKKLTLGGEVFGHGAEGQEPLIPSTRASTMADFGGFYNFNPGFSLLFAAGHSFAGQSETYAYLGLYWTWGKDKGKNSASLNLPPPHA